MKARAITSSKSARSNCKRLEFNNFGHGDMHAWDYAHSRVRNQRRLKAECARIMLMNRCQIWKIYLHPVLKFYTIEKDSKENSSGCLLHMVLTSLILRKWMLYCPSLNRKK